ncbi:MAG: alanine--tRNA ligase [Clostridiales bacterium]|nr:alanine--tRNA ligase [Clostridiales bacterium]
MKPLGLNEIREKYLAFFESKGHLRLPSFPLVPQNDPSILLINAGMTPMKPYFTGVRTPPSKRVTTCQKCIRTPDIENVGQTSRHGTYFEMLGNFSFGDYFKKEAIPWAWEFCTQVLEMPPEKLFPSVYEEDDEAFAIWKDDVGIPADRIARLGKDDNFWEHGTGPCGPCSEIYFDRGEDKGCGSPDCKPGCSCDRFVEIWNLVFTQFNKEEDGTYTPLAKKNIDTGGGLERFACVMQGVDNLFEVDTIRSILDTVCDKAGAKYGEDSKTDIALRVITDHARSSTMMISDGVLPSNEGRGYVLRRLMRRASRFGRILGIKDLFLPEIADAVIAQNRDAYPALVEKRAYIMAVIRNEEESFGRTIEQGSAILLEMIEKARSEGVSSLSGEQAFRLHDTYGFPLDLTREIATDAGMTVDETGFLECMKKQRDAARAATKAKSDTAWGGKILPEEYLRDTKATEFVGYDRLESEGVLRYLLKEDEEGALQTVPEAFEGDRVIAVFDSTPFYATSGGQMTDTGSAGSGSGTMDILSVDKDDLGKFMHSARVTSGTISLRQTIRLRVDRARRMATARNHTSTHLLQKALRSVLGDHVEQSGSMVSEERLRFDFSHFQPVSEKELAEIEQMINDAILEAMPVSTRVMSQTEAREIGAMALFGEKYSDTVRVVIVGDEKAAYSIELCGGTHLTNTAQAAQFRILSETGIASGVRRIEAVTGKAAYRLAIDDSDVLKECCDVLKANKDQLVRKIKNTLDEIKSLEKQMEQIRTQGACDAAGELADQAEEINGVSVVIAEVSADSPEDLRETADRIRDRLPCGVVVLAAVNEKKLFFSAMASEDAIKKGVHAGDIIRETAKAAGGGGGGRPDMAQAGGRNIELLPEALAVARQVIEKQIDRT